MSECQHHTLRIVKSSKGQIASACCDCISDDDLKREGYLFPDVAEVEFIMRTEVKPPPILNPDWFRVSRDKQRAGTMVTFGMEIPVYE